MTPRKDFSMHWNAVARRLAFVACLAGTGPAMLNAQQPADLDNPWAVARGEYHQRLATIHRLDEGPEALFALTEWCRSKKLFGEMRRTAKAVLAADPDHQGAHEVLGHMRVEGRWLPKRDAMEALGFVLYKDRWLPLDEVADLRAEEGRVQRRMKLQREVDREVRRLAGSSDALSDRALAALIALGERENIPTLAPAARQIHGEYRRYWAAVRSSTVVGLEIRAQQATLTRMRTLQTSLGTGAPVTLELPEVRRTSINTSVLVPAGR
jgi:hypothetical protein